jgi:uncharacterized damage-inducible protein DinB
MYHLRMDQSLTLSYGWVKRTRAVLFEYTQSLPREVYILEHPEFAHGSIRNIQAHVLGCYAFWVGQMGLGLEPSETDPSSLPDAAAVRAKFAEVDTLLEQALLKFDRLDDPLELLMPEGHTLSVSQRWLIIHPITHEFHHKGQLLALGRVLGHPLPAGQFADLVLP